MHIKMHVCILLFMPFVALGETLKELEAKAQAGDGEAQFKLGVRYSTGDGVDKNPPKAVYFWQLASEKGSANAQNNLAFAYYEGIGIEKNPKKAFELWRKAAEKGDPTHVNNLAFAYRDGIGTEINTKKAYALWLKNAEEGHAGSQNMVAFAYEEGIGIEKNPDLAKKWFYRAAENGNISAIKTLAVSYELGTLFIKDLQKSFEFKLKAAELGDVESQEQVADAYEDGAGVEKNLQEAIKWHDKAFQQILKFAENGESEFQFKLANKYLYGRDGIEKNLKKGFDWLRKAAEAGNIDAQAQLGRLHGEISAVYPLSDSSYINPQEAQKWLFKAAEAGSSDAQRYLGASFEYGRDGFEKNIKEAIKWYRKAGENGDQVSLMNAKELEGHVEAASDKSFDKIINNERADVSKTSSQAKIALLIANSKYSQFGGLANTDSDAQKLAKVLNSLGFQVSILKNASKEEMLDALKVFEAKVRGTNAIAFFHYGGHGVQVEGKNYFIPADAEIPDERRVSTRAVDLDEVIAVLDSAKPKASVLVVDACRHNPLPATATRSATRGLAVVGRKPKNSVIIYAAEAGNEAFDGLFTPILAENLQEHSDKSLNQIMQKVRAEVFERSKGAQTPGEYNQLFEDLFFSKN